MRRRRRRLVIVADKVIPAEVISSMLSTLPHLRRMHYRARRRAQSADNFVRTFPFESLKSYYFEVPRSCDIVSRVNTSRCR